MCGSRVTRYFGTLQGVQEDAEKQFPSDLRALGGTPGCLPVTGRWQICLQPCLLTSGFETSRREFAGYFGCWSVYLAKAGLLPVGGACKAGAVVFGYEQLLFAQRT